MTKTARWVFAMAALLVARSAPAAVGAESEVPVGPAATIPCPASKPAKDKDVAEVAGGRNTLLYDHYRLMPVCDRPMVLSVKDGDYFQVVVKNTDTTQFSYSITAVPDQEVPTTTSGATGKGLPVTRWSETSVTMRHSKAFARYRVTIALRSDLATGPGAKPASAAKGVAGAPEGPPLGPELLPATFDVWVKTRADFEVSFTGGAAFSGLRSPQYFVRTDDRGTPPVQDDVKTVEQAESAEDKFRPDVIAVANLRFPQRFKGFGLAFGVGMNNDSDPRYFLGPSYFFGRHFLLHAGWAGGRVDRLPTGQELLRPPINGDATLSSLPKRFASAFYVGVSFGFAPGSEDAFKGAFGSAQKTAKPGTPAPAEPPPAQPPGDLSKYDGTYAAADPKAEKPLAEIKVTGTKHEDWELRMQFKDSAGAPKGEARILKHQVATTFVDGQFACRLSESAGKQALECGDEKDKDVFKGAKKP